MNVIENDNVVCFDVDDTMVIWNYPPELAAECIEFNKFGFSYRMLPHGKHLELLKQFRVRGHYVIVWSQGGWAWAKGVVETLGLKKYVNQVMTKPKWMIDDKKPASWSSVSYIPIPGVIEPKVGNWREDVGDEECSVPKKKRSFWSFLKRS